MAVCQRHGVALCCFFGVVLLAGCGGAPESFPMPAQKPAPKGSDPHAIFLTFADPSADQYIVRDIIPGSGPWRWTLDHPELRIPVEPRPGLLFEMGFQIHERTFADTGPVTVTVKINAHPLGSIYCDHFGAYRFRRAVPEDWIRPREPAHVSAESSPLWIAPDDGGRLGFLIEEAGFRW